MSKRIGILTSGGDCSGLNAAIRAVVARAEDYGWEVIGFEDGTMGLFDQPPRVRTLSPSAFDGTILRQGGTILGTTNKGDPFAFPMPDGTKKDRSEELIAAIKGLGIDCIIGIGGDGSFAILRRLAQQGGLNLVGIPKTIDNDLGCTEQAIGFNSAVDVATEALDRLQPTAASHHRCMVLEVMGRDAGHIALSAGIAGGADVILIPEIPYRIDKVADKIRRVNAKGRRFALVVVSEAVKTAGGDAMMVEHAEGQKRYGGVGNYVAQKITEATGAETRVTVLGHVQRGGTPNPSDRILGSAFGVHAVDLIMQERYDRLVVWSQRGVTDVPIEEAIKEYRAVDVQGSLVRTGRALGISFGD